jgi:hypothetical protein
VVVNKNEGGGIIFKSAFGNLAGGDSTAIYGAFKKINYFNNLILAV